MNLPVRPIYWHFIAFPPPSPLVSSCTTLCYDCANDPDHGTWCAGIVAAVQNNATGISGVAPTSSVISVSVDFNTGTDQTFADAINWAWDQGNASVMSCSWGTGGDTTTSILADAVNNALTEGRGGLGSVLVFGSGNDANLAMYGDVHYTNNVAAPGNMSVPGATVPVPISVGGIDRCGARSGTSDQVSNACDPWFGTDAASDEGISLTVCAPGTSITSCSRVGQGTGGGDYIIFDGTSGACPHVAGLAALILSVDPCLTNVQVNAIIESNCQQVDATAHPYANTTGRPYGHWNRVHGYGLIDAYASLQAVLNTPIYLQDITENSTIIRANLGPVSAGYDVNSAQTQGPYIISSTANVEIKSTQAITFEPGFVTEPGAVMLAHVLPFDDDCSQWPSSNLLFKNGGTPIPDAASPDAPALQNTIHIYPNPFTNEIQIAFGITEDRTSVDIVITDLTGQIVYQKRSVFNIGNQNISTTLSSSASMYIAKVCVGNNCNTQKLVKYESH